MDELNLLELKILKELEDVSRIQHALIENSQNQNSVLAFRQLHSQNQTLNSSRKDSPFDIQQQGTADFGSQKKRTSNNKRSQAKPNVQKSSRNLKNSTKKLQRNSSSISDFFQASTLSENTGSSIIQIEFEKENLEGNYTNQDGSGYQSSNEFLVQKNWQKKFELRKSRAGTSQAGRLDYFSIFNSVHQRPPNNHSESHTPIKLCSPAISRKSSFSQTPILMKKKSKQDLTRQSISKQSQAPLGKKFQNTILTPSKQKIKKELTFDEYQDDEGGTPRRTAAAQSSKKSISEKYLTPTRSAKKPVFEEYTFQPSISKRSKKLAENRGPSFARLIQVKASVGPTSEDLELQKCTFIPAINKDKNFGDESGQVSQRIEKLREYGEKSKMKIEKLRKASEIRQRLESSKDCTFKPQKLNNYQPVMTLRGDVVDRMNDWELRKHKKQAQLAKQILDQETYSFRPQTTKYSKNSQMFPKQIKQDPFLLEGMSNFLDKQSKALQIRSSNNEKQDKFQVSRGFNF